MFVTWVLVGVLAELVMKRGGYGLKTDITTPRRSASQR